MGARVKWSFVHDKDDQGETAVGCIHDCRVAAGQVFVLVGTDGVLKTIDQSGGASIIEKEGISIAKLAQVPATQIEELQKTLVEWQSQLAAVL